MRRNRSRACAAATLLAACALAARGDVEETEQRLKRAGVDEALRERIHASIARGAKFLLTVQDRDGRFGDPSIHWSKSVAESGYTALCSLALSHVGSADATKAAGRGVRFLVPEGKDPRTRSQRSRRSAPTMRATSRSAWTRGPWRRSRSSRRTSR